MHEGHSIDKTSNMGGVSAVLCSARGRVAGSSSSGACREADDVYVRRRVERSARAMGRDGKERGRRTSADGETGWGRNDRQLWRLQLHPAHGRRTDAWFLVPGYVGR